MIFSTPEALRDRLTGALTLPPRRSGPQTGTMTAANAVQTQRLYLSPLTREDTGDIRQICAHPSVARMTHAIASPFNEADAIAFVEKARLNSSPRLPVFGIRTPDDNLIGVVSLDRETCGQAGGLHLFGPSVGIIMAPAHQGHGYGAEAIEGLTGYAQRFGGHRVLHAAHFADNAPSARMLAKAGFLYTGRRTLETSKAREGTHEALHMIRLL